MIEKIMKAVKSGNKKRGRNITIGAVVGLLLSCTAVMGADNYLWIKNDGGTIKFNTVLTATVDGSDGNWQGTNPYDENGWNGSTYINNIFLSSTKTNGKNNENGNISYGLKLSGDLENINFKNNGSIIGEGSEIFGIYNAGTVKTLTNTGYVLGTAEKSLSYGIGNFQKISTLTNEGTILAIGKSTKGIVYNGEIEFLKNDGNILAMVALRETPGSELYNSAIEGSGKIGILASNGLINVIIRGASNGYGILSRNNIGNIINNGSITATAATTIGTTGSTYGIYNDSTGGTGIGKIINTGVIYGKDSAVKNVNGTITSLDNYGILATGGSSVIEGTIGSKKNYGLYIEETTGKVTSGSITTGPVTVVVGYDGSEIKRDMTIKNAQIEGLSGSATSTKSFELSGNSTSFNDSIINGKNKTLKVSGTGNKVSGSIINAYGSAIVFDDTVGGEIILSGTIVNIQESKNEIILGSSNGDTLILQSGTVTYKDGSTGTQNTIINGNIDMKNGNNTLVIGTGTIINGGVFMGNNDDTVTVEAGSIVSGYFHGVSGNNTINFNSATTKTSSNDRVNILSHILFFKNMNINTNVTIFEKTFNDTGKTDNLMVMGTERISIGANGALTLRIDSSKKGTAGDAGKIIGHALYGNTDGTITSTGGGKLLLAISGADKENIISFGGTKLGDGFITAKEGEYQEDVTLETTSLLHSIEKIDSIDNEVKVVAKVNLPRRTPDDIAYEKLNKIYQSLIDEVGNFNVDDNEKLSIFLSYLNDIYAGNPYSYSSELSRKSAGMFRDIVTDNQFKPNLNNWLIYGGLTHIDGGTKDTYYGKGYYTYDVGSSDMDADTKITGAYMLGEYGVSETLTSGVIIGGNKLKSDLSNGSKVDGDALYLGAYAKKYMGNLKVTAGAGFQYGDYDVDRMAVNRVANDTEMAVIKYSDNYNDMTYDIYLNGRYSNPIGDNLFLEPYGTLSYTYTKQDGANEGSKTLTIETDSKSFDYTSAKVGVDLKKVISHEKGKSTLSAGVSYTKILDGAEEEYITGRFKGGSDFDILVAHKNEHSIGLNAKYTLELENGILFDVKGTYSVERDSNNNSGKNKSKGEWIAGAGIGYKF